MLSSTIVPFCTPNRRTPKDGHRGTHGRGWKATTSRKSQGRPYKYQPYDMVTYKAMQALFAHYDLDDLSHDMLAMMAGIA